MVWRVTNEPVDCRPSRGTNKHTQDRKKCSLLDDNSTATADYDSARANYAVNYIRQLQNHDYIHMTTTTSYNSILLHVTKVYSLLNFTFYNWSGQTCMDFMALILVCIYKYSIASFKYLNGRTFVSNLITK